MEYKAKNFITSSPFFQGQRKGDPHLANDTFLLNLPLWSFGVFHACHCIWNLDSRLTTLVLPSLTKTFSNHFLLGWFLPLTTSIISPCQNPLSCFDLSSRTQTSRIRQNLPPLFAHGMRNIDQQTSTLQHVSSSTIDIYLTTQNISTDTANNNLNLTVWGKFSIQTRLKTAHKHISKYHLSTARWQLHYILFHIHSSLWQTNSLCSPCCRIIRSFQVPTSSPDIEQDKWSMFPTTLKHLGWVERAH